MKLRRLARALALRSVFPAARGPDGRHSRRRSSARRALVASCLLTTSLALEPGRAAGGGGPSALEIEIRAGRVTLTARAVPLRDVLAALGSKARVAIHIEEAPDRSIAAEPLTVQFEDLTVEDSLRRLLAGRNHTMIFSGGRLDEIWVLQDGARLARPPPPRETATSDEEAPDPERIRRLSRDALAKPTPLERVHALGLLTDHADPTTQRDVAITVLREETDGSVRDKAYELLEEGTAPVPIGPLLELPRMERDLARRIRALELLAERGAGDPRVGNLLREIAADPRQRDLRETAQHLLGGQRAN